MQILMHILGMTILGLIGVAFVLGLVMLVLLEVRLVVRLAGRVSIAELLPPHDYLPDPPSQQAFDGFWQI